MTEPALRAPFPWYGGKSRAAPLLWRAFGNVPNYVEPFAGSLATLLARPHAPHVETVNDLNGMIANFWRATAAAPDSVARFADWPLGTPGHGINAPTAAPLDREARIIAALDGGFGA